MKGRISPRLERILQNPTARLQLREALEQGQGTVTLEGQSYRVRASVTTRPPAAEPARP